MSKQLINPFTPAVQNVLRARQVSSKPVLTVAQSGARADARILKMFLHKVRQHNKIAV